MKTGITAVASSLLAVLALLPHQATAGAFTQLASEACRGARAVDEQALFRDIFGLINTSTKGVSIICSVATFAVQTPPNTQYEVSRLDVEFLSKRTVVSHIHCSFTQPGGVPDLLDIRFDIPANGNHLLTITPGPDRLGQNTYALTCNMPPQIELGRIFGQTREWELIPMQ